MPTLKDELVARCEALGRVYGQGAVLCVLEDDAKAAGLAKLAGKMRRRDVPLGRGFSLDMVEIPAAAALKALRAA